MRSKCLVHIGYHKTATTWLQKELFSPSSKFFYPLSKDEWPKHLGKYFIYDEEGYLLSPFQSRKDAFLNEFESIQKMYAGDSRVGVISNERLSGNPHSGGFDARSIADRLHESLPNATILCVIRRQQDIILSMYMQYIKVGGTDSLKEYLCRTYDGKRPGFSPGYLNYIDLVNYYTGLFGRDQVLVLPFELFREAPGEFFGMVCKTLSIDGEITIQKADRPQNRHLNDFVRLKFPGLNRFAICSSVNGYSTLRIPGFDRVLGLASRSFGLLGQKLTEKYRSQAREFIGSFVADRYKTGNRLLSSRIGIDLSKYRYFD